MIIRVDGGSAFPVVTELGMESSGMSLRDYFAAKAMQAFAGAEYDSRLECEHWARHAYMMADAMLKERAK